MCVCVRENEGVCACTCVCVCVFVGARARVHACIYTFTYTHKHTHLLNHAHTQTNIVNTRNTFNALRALLLSCAPCTHAHSCTNTARGVFKVFRVITILSLSLSLTCTHKQECYQQQDIQQILCARLKWQQMWIRITG